MMIQELLCAQKNCRKGQEALISCDYISTWELLVDLSSLEDDWTPTTLWCHTTSQMIGDPHFHIFTLLKVHSTNLIIWSCRLLVSWFRSSLVCSIFVKTCIIFCCLVVLAMYWFFFILERENYDAGQNRRLQCLYFGFYIFVSNN